MFASITIDVLTNSLNDTYTYHIPEEFEKYIGIGSRVLVNFGVRKVLGYVIELKDENEYSGAVKDIVEVLDYSKELTIEQIEMAKKISQDTKCPLIRAIDVMFPSFLKTKYRKFISIKNVMELDPNILMLFGDKRKICLTADLIKEYPKIRKEIEVGNLALDYDIFTYGKRKLIKSYTVNEACENIYIKFDGVKKRLIDYLLRKGTATIDEIKEDVGCSIYLLSSLVKQEILYVKDVFYNEIPIKNKVLLRNLDFSFDKQTVKDRFTNLSNLPFLLYSNDDAFNLDLYLDICIDMILRDKKILIITPTLIINYNVYHYLKKRLKGFDVINFSGDMSNGEYYNNYMKLRQGGIEVVVATKVGAFLPMDNIGTIIVIDESNFNYINEQTPKYNVIEMMKFRAKYHNAKIILASNPLTIENYYNYFRAQYNILKYVVPNKNTVNLINMYDEVILDREIISRKLENDIKLTLNNHKQVMLILNARGYSNHLVCRSCGTVALCPKCHIPVTYYKDKDEIKCRYCGSKLESLKCKCGEDSYAMYGFGLEMVNEKIKQMFPNAKTIVLDSDSMKDYADYQETVVKIESNEVDIIIGTNNILSLSNYSNIDLVGLIAVDNLLNTSDYRASYNTFYLICNAVKSASVDVQGYNLDHYAIKYGVNSDFVSFYNEEIKVRETFNYPPYYEINKIVISGEFKEMYHCANYIKKAIQTIFGNVNLALGPNYIKQKRGVQLLVKHNDFVKISKLLDEVKKKFENSKLEISFERYPRSFN